MRFRNRIQQTRGRQQLHHSSTKKHHVLISARRIVLVVLTSIVVLYLIVAIAWYRRDNQHDNNNKNASSPHGPNQLLRNTANQQQQRRRENMVQANDEKINLSAGSMQYKDWRALAVKLASLPSQEVLEALDELDPFGVRTFEKDLLQAETDLKRVLTLDEIQQLFPCPQNRISLPDLRLQQKALDFRNAKPGSFLFFQHLRKAGGTHFCTLAQANLPKRALPPYYCMPDMVWSGNKAAGYLHHWSNADIVAKMKQHRVAGNEWDNFDVKNHFDLPAVFATSFRRPLDRALSQFRFECIEERGCKIKDVGKWWKRRTDLNNVYTCTFSDGDCRQKVYTDDSLSKQRGEMMGTALDTVAKFNLVLVMEWLSYAAPQVQSVLGFADTSVLTKRVRPHINQAHREDGQEQNLGAAGIAKASWIPKDYLTAEQYEDMSNSLALDEILTDAARRLFLERLVCPAI